jgi:mannose/fructose/N-acetylgalactosamine-specific phosphotransferase system component IIB
VKVVTVAEAAQIHAAEAAATGGAFLLVRNLLTALALVEAGAPIRRCNRRRTALRAGQGAR